jgi:uncharacterized damage-inducible protein DinB
MSSHPAAYPIGPFTPPARFDASSRAVFIDQIGAAPQALRRAVEGLSDAQLDTPYREGGWTVRQVVHHLADSHVNGYVRFKLMLTEDTPEARMYQQATWAELPEAQMGPIAMSLDLLTGLHARWVASLRALPPSAFERTLRHPRMGIVSLDHQLALYAWHGRHHVAHVTTLASQKGWA